MDEFERDLENYLVELDGSSFPLDEDIFLEDAESHCSSLSSEFDDLSDEGDVDEGFAVSSDGESENQYGGADDRLSSDDDDVYAQMRRNAREAEGSYNNIEIRRVLQGQNDYFGVTHHAYRFVPGDNTRGMDFLDGFSEMLEDIEHFVRTNHHRHDMVELFVNSNEFSNDGVSVPLHRVEDLNMDTLFMEVEKVSQSNEGLGLDDESFTVEVVLVNMPRGGGYESRHLLHSFGQKTHDILKNTRALYCPPAGCHPYCAVVCLIFADEYLRHGGRMRRRTTLAREREMIEQARRMCRRCGITPSRQGLELKDLEKICKVFFRDHSVFVVSKQHYNSVVFTYKDSPLDITEFTIYLFLDDGHYYFIKSLNSLMGKHGSFCPICEKFFQGKKGKGHKCDNGLCLACKTECGSRESVATACRTYRCDACRRLFFSPRCLQNHTIRGLSRMYPKTSVCQAVVACTTCDLDLKAKNGVARDIEAYTGRRHVCFTGKCFCCNRRVDMLDHQCYVQPIRPDDEKFKKQHDKKRGEYIFADIETMKEERDGESVLTCNLVVVITEGGQEFVFSGRDSLQKFAEYLFCGPDSLVSHDKNYTVLFHNGARFDCFYVLKAFCDNIATDDPKVLFDGKSPLKIQFGKVQIIDSFRYFMAPLAKLPAMFGITDVCKGKFPHDFNTKHNQHYRGVIPDKEFFGTRFMKSKELKEFEDWYEEWWVEYRAGRITHWDLQEELVKYCVDDVRVLRRCWLTMAKEMYDLSKLWIGIGNCTGASFTNMVFRTMLKPNTIGLIPKGKYFKNHIQSKVGKEWLVWNDVFYYAGELRYSGKEAGEKVIRVGRKKYRVDGYHEPSKSVLEFFGCAFHGCPRCFDNDYVSVFTGKTARVMQLETSARLADLQSEGFECVVIWECDWKALKNSDQEVRRQLGEIREELAFNKPFMNPRDALYGGRTEAFAMYAGGDDSDEYIQAADVTSLYPHVMKNKLFPCAHPSVIRGSPDKFCYDLDKYFGLMYCKLIPPRGLFIPTLPFRCPLRNGSTKLMFCLCSTCAKTLQQEDCHHSDEERALEGAWCSVEVYRAVRDGYRLVEIYEVWHYVSVSPSIFTEFVNAFYKIKTECSGWPEGCDSIEQKERFLREFAQHEGVELDPDKIENNPGKRFCAKILLNSLWGFFCRRLDKPKTSIYHDADQFFAFCSDDTLHDKSFKLINDTTVIVKGKQNEESVFPDKKGNVVVSCFVTAYARLELLDIMRAVDMRVLYADTDSVFYRLSEGDATLPLGDYLGQLTPVMPSKEHVGIEFVAGGPKNYGLKYCKKGEEDDVSKHKAYFKVRGITLNKKTEEIVNFDKLKQFVLESFEKKELTPNSVTVEKFNIKRGLKNGMFDVASEVLEKKYRLVFDKRRIDFDSEDFVTYPFGY